MVRIVPRLSRLLRVSALTLLVAFLLALGMAAAEPGTITRVSVDSAGGEANGWSFDAALSADGRFVAFDSVASNLVPGDTNGHRDVFVHDRLTGATTRVSVDSSGGQGNGGSLTPALSADGRLVAFHSFASNLVPGDTNGHADVFVHDRETGATIRVSVDSTGGEAKCLSAAACGGSTTTVASDRPALSADGCFVAFRSGFANLVPADTNGHADIFVHDRQSSATTRVSVDSTGGEGISGSFTPALSADGRFVAFHSHAFNLVPGTTNSVGDIFVHDRLTGVTTRVSVDSAGGEGNGLSDRPALSADGRFVAFRSQASNLVPGDTNGVGDIFVHDRLTGVGTEYRHKSH